MTFVKGFTTWGGLEAQLAALACGEVADGSGVTVDSASRWMREVTRTVTDGATTSGSTTASSVSANFTSADLGAVWMSAGVPVGTTIQAITNSTTVVLSQAATASGSGVNVQIASTTIRTPASTDVSTGNCSGRAGYWLATGAGFGATGGSISPASCRQMTLPTTPTTLNGRWVIVINVITGNTTPGSYNQISIQWLAYDPDAASSTISSGINVSPSAAGLLTLGTLGQVSITSPDGLVPTNAKWVRAFTTTYPYGIDCWPMLYRRGTAAPTFSVAPAGTQGTDWDIAEVAAGGTNTSLQGASGGIDRGTIVFYGLGIKTATANNGAIYTASFPMALIKCRMTTSTVGLILEWGASKRDAVNGTYRFAGGPRMANWLRCFTAGPPVSSTAVQYWLSVTADGIVLALNADTAANGRLGTAFICKYTPAEPTYDVLPVQANFGYLDYTADNSVGVGFDTTMQYSYYSLRWRQDGSENRDWQTRWMRGDHLNAGGFFAGTDRIDWVSTSSAYTGNSGGLIVTMKALGVATDGGNSYTPFRLTKPGPDGKWTFFGMMWGDYDWGTGASASTIFRVLRGSQTTRFAYIPNDGWGNGDELTDTATGQKWLLLTPDYAAYGHARTRTSANAFTGGVAIAEI